MALGVDVLGNIVLFKFDRSFSFREKKKVAKDFLERHKSVKTALEKVGKFSGRLRIQNTRWLAGENTKEVLYKENACVFRFNVDTCYFSPRLASERLKIAKKVKKFERVLVMFGGVAPFAIVIAKNNKVARVVSVELGRDCSKYARMNVKRNKLEGIVEIIQGDVRKKVPLLKFSGNVRDNGFDRVVMARPNLKDSFLDVAFGIVKKSGVIHYYGFYKDDEIKKLKELVLREAKKARKKIKIVKIERAGGEIGPYKKRYRVDVKVLD